MINSLFFIFEKHYQILKGDVKNSSLPKYYFTWHIKDHVGFWLWLGNHHLPSGGIRVALCKPPKCV